MLRSKKSVLKESSSVPQRFNSLQAVVRTSDEQKLAIAKYVGCSIGWLMNKHGVKFEPKAMLSDMNSSVLFTILDIMDGCPDNDIDTAMQIQLSRIVLYHLSEKGFGTEKLSTLSGIDQNKLHFILTGKENKDSSLNYGFNFSDLVYIKNVTGLDYSYLFSGK